MNHDIKEWSEEDYLHLKNGNHCMIATDRSYYWRRSTRESYNGYQLSKRMVVVGCHTEV